MAKLEYESIITDDDGLIVYDDTRGRVILLNKYFGDKYSYQEVKNRIFYDRPAEPNYEANGKRYIANRETYEKLLEIRRTILWKKEAEKAVVKEKQRLKEIERVKGKGKSKNMLDKICSKCCFCWDSYGTICLRNLVSY